MMSVTVQTQAFDAGAELSAFTLGLPDAGGVVTFTGIARMDDGKTQRLELEAYPGFTEPWIEALVAKASARFHLSKTKIIHRVGMILPGEAIVFVATAACHRRQAFEGADFLMDHLKSRAPFWKKEYGPEGARWIEPRAEDFTDLTRWTAEAQPE